MTTALTIPNVKELEQIKALQVSVNSPETKADAEVYLIKIDRLAKQLTADIKSLKAPYQAEIDRIDATTRPYKDMLVERKSTFGRAIIDYNNKLAEQVRLANAKALGKYEKKVDRLEEKAIEQGKPLPVVAPPVLLTEPPKTVQTEVGKLTTVKRKTWRLQDCADDPATLTALTAQVKGLHIPLDWFVLDTTRVGKVIRAGGTIPGIDVIEEETLAVRA